MYVQPTYLTYLPTFLPTYPPIILLIVSKHGIILWIRNVPQRFIYSQISVLVGAIGRWYKPQEVAAGEMGQVPRGMPLKVLLCSLSPSLLFHYHKMSGYVL